jgi:hypothetical protein
MPRIDFSNVEDPKDFTPLPEDDYLCRVDNVEEALTGAGDEMWKVRHLVTKGEFKGRYIFDNLVFSEKALKRAKLILRCLGVDVSGEINLTPEMIKGKQAIVTVKLEDYVDDEGREKKRNRVPFAGYEKPDDDDITEATSGGGAKLPF